MCYSYQSAKAIKALLSQAGLVGGNDNEVKLWSRDIPLCGSLNASWVRIMYKHNRQDTFSLILRAFNGVVKAETVFRVSAGVTQQPIADK